MRKIRKALIAIGIISAMTFSFAGCEKESSDSKLNPYSSKSSGEASNDNAEDIISKAMQDGDVIFNFDGFTLLDGDTPPAKKDDSSSGATNSSKADGGESSKANDGASSDSESADNSGSNNSSNSSQTKRPEYKDIQTLWFDSGLQSDLIFDGETLLFTFKIKDDAEEGTYPINFTRTDIANYGSKTVSSQILDVKAINGSVTVDGDAKKDETSSGSGFIMTASNESGKPGDEITVTVNLKNNPGFAGLDIHLQYDSNALEIVKTGTGKDFKEALGK